MGAQRRTAALLDEARVRGAVLPAQVGLALLEDLAGLLDVGTHELAALLRVLLDHLQCLEAAIGRCEVGIPTHGFLRLRCSDRGHAKLLAFSCERRAFCLSCGAGRTSRTAAHLGMCTTGAFAVDQPIHCAICAAELPGVARIGTH